MGQCPELHTAGAYGAPPYTPHYPSPSEIQLRPLTLVPALALLRYEKCGSVRVFFSKLRSSESTQSSACSERNHVYDCMSRWV